MDLFLLESKTCLSLIIEISQLSHTRSNNVIVHIMSIVDRYGIPEVLMSDNRAQFLGTFFFIPLIWEKERRGGQILKTTTGAIVSKCSLPCHLENGYG